MSEAPEMIVTLGNDTLGPAFKFWLANQMMVRNKSLMDVTRRLTQYWVSYAMAEIEKKAPSSVAKIESDLMKMARVSWRTRNVERRRLRGSRNSDRFRNTVASKIVFMLNYGQARTKAAFGDDAGAYAQVAKFVGARKYSRRHHKVSGFMPTLLELAKGRRGVLADTRDAPKYQQKPGSYFQVMTASFAETMVSAWPSAAARPGRPEPLGLAGLVPGAFTSKVNDLRRNILEWVDRDGLLTRAAAQSGFTVTSS